MAETPPRAFAKSSAEIRFCQCFQHRGPGLPSTHCSRPFPWFGPLDRLVLPSAHSASVCQPHPRVSNRGTARGPAGAAAFFHCLATIGFWTPHLWAGHCGPLSGRRGACWGPYRCQRCPPLSAAPRHCHWLAPQHWANVSWWPSAPSTLPGSTCTSPTPSFALQTAPAKFLGTSNFWAGPLATTISSSSTQLNERPKPATFWMQSGSSQTRKWAFGSSAPALGLPSWFTACAVTRPTPNRLPSACLMGWCVAALGIWQGFTLWECNGSKLPSDLHDVRAALAALNANLHPQDQISFEAASHSKQHDLSLKLDLAGWQEQLGHHCGSSHFTVRGLLGCAGLLGSHTGWPGAHGTCHFCCRTTRSFGHSGCRPGCLVPPLRWDLGRANLPRRDVRCRWWEDPMAPRPVGSDFRMGWKRGAPPWEGETGSAAATVASWHQQLMPATSWYLPSGVGRGSCCTWLCRNSTTAAGDLGSSQSARGCGCHGICPPQEVLPADWRSLSKPRSAVCAHGCREHRRCGHEDFEKHCSWCRKSCWRSWQPQSIPP